MACGEWGFGRMAEPEEILAAIEAHFAPSGAARRRAGAGHQRADPRADRPGPLHLQPLLRPAGPRHRRGAGPAGRRDHAGRRARPRSPIRPASASSASRRRGRCWRPARRRCRSMSPSAPPRSPTGGSSRPSQQKIKKEPAGPPALALAENPDILATLGRSGRPAAAAGGGFRRRDLARRRQRRRQAGAQGLRLDRRQRRLARHRHLRRRRQHRPPDLRRAAIEDWPPMSKTAVARAARRPHRRCAGVRSGRERRDPEALELAVRRLPHGARPAAAGLCDARSRRRSICWRRSPQPLDPGAGWPRAGADRHRHRPAGGLRGAGAAALRAGGAPWRHRAQQPRHHRRRLSRRDRASC